MKNLFIGMIFVFLNFTISISGSSIDIIPDFIGFYLILKGLEELKGYSEKFIKIRPLVIILGIYSLLTFALGLFGITNNLGNLAFVLVLINVIALIYVTYNIILGIMDIEKNINISIETNIVMNRWKMMIAFNVLSYVVLIVLPVIAIVSVIFYLVFAVLFLVSFNNSKNLYYEYIGECL